MADCWVGATAADGGRVPQSSAAAEIWSPAVDRWADGGGDENLGSHDSDGAAVTESGAVLRQRQDSAGSPAAKRGGEGVEGAKKGRPSPGSALKQQPAAAAAAQTPGTPTTRAALRRQLMLQQQQEAAAAALAGGGAVAAGGGDGGSGELSLVDAAEFAALPAWCNRQLTLQELNRALEGMNTLVAARCVLCGADAGPTVLLCTALDCFVGVQSFKLMLRVRLLHMIQLTDLTTPPPTHIHPSTHTHAHRPVQPGSEAEAVGLDTLQALGFDSGKGRAIFNSLSKLGRAQPQRVAGGGAMAYRLVAP